MTLRALNFALLLGLLTSSGSLASPFQFPFDLSDGKPASKLATTKLHEPARPLIFSDPAVAAHSSPVASGLAGHPHDDASGPFGGRVVEVGGAGDSRSTADVNDSGDLYDDHELFPAGARDFTTLTHPDFPGVSVRLKRHGRRGDGAGVGAMGEDAGDGFCDTTVTSWSGYVDTIDGKSFFMYFFESRNDPENDDVIMWTNGGPGCSSSLGLFMELGPCRIATAAPSDWGSPSKGNGVTNSTVYNPYGWNDRANVFFIDQPVGVGFSYRRFGQPVGRTEDAARDIYAFLRIFFSAFSRFKDNKFHLAGESYGGRYLPVFASTIVDGNAKAAPADKINLQTVLIGNGLTDGVAQHVSGYEFACTKKGGASPPIDIESCVAMASALPSCKKMMEKECRETFDQTRCSMAFNYCTDLVATPYIMNAARNPYNIEEDCTPDQLQDSLCYPVTKNITSYLDREDVRSVLGVPDGLGAFQSCSSEVGGLFAANLDMVAPTHLYVAGLLERGVKVLVYVGTLDWICNWLGNYEWVQSLEWSGAGEFADAAERDWLVNGKVAGRTRSAAGLTWATVYGAGHMVPYDKPAQALEMLNRWLADEEL